MKIHTPIVGTFDKKEKFGFLVPDDKKKYPTDFFVALRNSNNAGNGDLVEAVEIKSLGKSKEARILKILQKNTGIQAIKYEGEAQKKDCVRGKYSQGKGDFGYVDVPGLEKGYFVFSQNRNSAMDGDLVEARLKMVRGRQEASIIRVLERRFEMIVGEFCPRKKSTSGFVIPQNPLIQTDIFVFGKDTHGATAGDIVAVHIVGWKEKNPQGVIKEILGKKGEKNIQVTGVLLEGGARMKFSEEVLKYAETLKTDVSKSPGKDSQRHDLTNLFTFTIDGEDAKDLDDAISIEQLPDGKYKLFVHIADVAQYVLEKNPLDQEAYKRATSIYLVDRVIPMLPEKLSNDLCSLNPHTNKLTLTCEIILGEDGAIQSQKVYESTICSDFRLTYQEVDEILNQKKMIDSTLFDGGKVSIELIQALQTSHTLKQKITKMRQKNGVLNFDFPETKIHLDQKGNPHSIEQYPKYDSNTLIEEFMICANEAVSREFSDLPFLYRIHEEPKEEDLTKLQETLNLFGIHFVFNTGDTGEFSKLLEILHAPQGTHSKNKTLDPGSLMFLEKAILRTLSKAIYSHENLGHFGLGLEFYSHFTSPIRRYPDLQIHRIIKEKLHKKLDVTRIQHYKTILEEVAKHTSDQERIAEKLEYRVRDYFIVQFYKHKVSQVFEGVISGVIQKGFFVVLPDTAEGMVELPKSQFNDDLKEHKDRENGKRYRLGDTVKVKLSSVDEQLFRLNFEVI